MWACRARAASLLWRRTAQLYVQELALCWLMLMRKPQVP